MQSSAFMYFVTGKYHIALATAGSDFSSMSCSLAFPVDSSYGAEECTNISVLEDTVFEGSEYFHVTLSVLTSNVTSARSFTQITIIDNDSMLAM